MRRRGLALAALASGVAIVVLAQRLTPIAGPPLYDGVVVINPYRWLSPPPGLQGGAQSAQQSLSGQDIQGGFGIGTPEQPPQVEIDSDVSSLVIPKGTTSITVSIDPVAAPSAQPANGIVAGNVYRISVTNQSGAAIGAKTGGSVTLVLRGPASLPEASIERYSGGSWTELQTSPAGIPDTFTALVPGFGDFALVAPYAWVPAGESAASAASVGPAASSGSASITPPGSSGSAGLPLVPIAGVAVSFLVLVGCMIVLWLLGRPPKPGADG
ncbi:MAG: hypothetical protein ACHQ01_09700 [Candidatus Limnocylindrales bacterium]